MAEESIVSVDIPLAYSAVPAVAPEMPRNPPTCKKEATKMKQNRTLVRF